MSGQTLKVIEVHGCLGALIGGVPSTDYYQSNTGPEILAINYCFRLKYYVSMEVIVGMPRGLTFILNHKFPQIFVGVQILLSTFQGDSTIIYHI